MEPPFVNEIVSQCTYVIISTFMRNLLFVLYKYLNLTTESKIIINSK